MVPVHHMKQWAAIRYRTTGASSTRVNDHVPRYTLPVSDRAVCLHEAAPVQQGNHVADDVSGTGAAVVTIDAPGTHNTDRHK
jgi:hypothetical protein